MTVISDIGGTSNNSFSINGKVTLFQGDDIPEEKLGNNGDIYFQSNGIMWSKSQDEWHNMASVSLPDASNGPNKLLYSNGSYYTFADIELDNQGHLIVNAIDASSAHIDTLTTTKPSPTSSFTSDTVPSIGWVNDPTCSTNVVHKSGKETINGEKTFTETIQGTAYRAFWGDLAEYYNADAYYPEGTLMAFGGDNEVTVAKEDCNAVVSSNPGVILNSGDNFEYPCKLALVGRVPVRVIGKVNKFDYLKLSDIPGVAIVSSDDEFPMSNVIARALETKDTEEEGLVLCVVKFEL